jgi:Nuclease-related domain
MPTNHPYSRREFRRRLRDWLRRNLKLIALLTIGLVALIAVITSLVLATGPASPFTWWLLGVLQTGMVATYAHLLHTGFLAHDTDAIRHVRGAWGEDNTRSELQRAKRKKLVWGWADSLDLMYGDIDHLVVTRRGGLVAIDSKWRNKIHDTADMARSAQKVRLRAEGLTRDLLKGDSRGARRAKVNPLSVTAVVVVWGADQHTVPDGATVDGIEFIAGRRLVGWLARLDGQPVDQAAAAGILRSLDDRRASTMHAQAARSGDGPPR